MPNIIRCLGGLFIVAFITIQFFQPEKNRTKNTENHIYAIKEIPSSIQKLLNNACMDCHSSRTNYLWYHKVAPVSWIVNKHVIAGKNELNFSEWRQMDVYDKITILEEMCQEVQRKTMPLKSYKTMHPKAKLTNDEISEFCAWTTQLSEELLSKAIEN